MDVNRNRAIGVSGGAYLLEKSTANRREFNQKNCEA
jgi:hypothetical protein